MATYIPLYNLPIQFVDAAGMPRTAAYFEFYDAGTANPQDLFSDDTGTSIGIAITLNSLGMPESGGNTITLFRDQSKALKVRFLDADGATIFTSGSIPAVASFDSASSTKLATIETNADVTDAANVAAAGAYMVDGSKTLTADVTMGATKFLNLSVTAGITASVTQTQGEGLLTSGVNEISVCANTNDVATMPAALTGRMVVVINNGAETLQLFPASGETHNGAAVDASITMLTGVSGLFMCFNSTTWALIG